MLSRMLMSKGHTVELWVSDFDHISHKYFDFGENEAAVDKSLKVRYIHGKGYKSDLSPSRIIHNRQLAKDFSRKIEHVSKCPDIVYGQIPILELCEKVVDFGKKNDIPVIVDIRDLWPDVYRRLFPFMQERIVNIIFKREYIRLKRILSSTSAITAVSETYLKWALSYAGRMKRPFDKAIPLGFYPHQNATKPNDTKTSLIKGKYNIPLYSRLCTFTGTFCGSYDIDTPIQAARQLYGHLGREIVFVFAGKGEGFSRLKRMAAGLPNVVFTGWLNRESLKELLSISSWGLAPYSKKAIMSLPNKPFEYMSLSLPIISSLRGELWELIEKNRIGKNYNSGNAYELVAAIHELNDNPNKSTQMGSNAFELFQRSFSAEMVYTSFVQLMIELSKAGGNVYGA
jgi:glycosyltransferase involved in cell wall biosynthesis